jgi:hypothetical protein
MKMFRLALAGVLPAFVLFVAIQFSAGAASTPQSLAVESWLTGDDSSAITFGSRWGRSPTVTLNPRPPSLRHPNQGSFPLRIVSLTSEPLKKFTGAIASGPAAAGSVLIPSHRSMR